MTPTTQIIPSAERRAKIRAVASAVAVHFGHSLAELRRTGREQPRVFHRQIAIFLAVRLTAASYEEVAAFFGKKDHQTCVYATRTIMDRTATNRADAILVDGIRAKCLEALQPKST
jgi:chromosomal replication initiator protein